MTVNNKQAFHAFEFTARYHTEEKAILESIKRGGHECEEFIQCKEGLSVETVDVLIADDDRGVKYGFHQQGIESEV